MGDGRGVVVGVQDREPEGEHLRKDEQVPQEPALIPAYVVVVAPHMVPVGDILCEREKHVAVTPVGFSMVIGLTPRVQGGEVVQGQYELSDQWI